MDSFYYLIMENVTTRAIYAEKNQPTPSYSAGAWGANRLPRSGAESQPYGGLRHKQPYPTAAGQPNLPECGRFPILGKIHL
jgi:hypothetical protein